MESLKKFEEIGQPDIRQRAFVQFDMEQGGMRPLILKDFFDEAESVQLHEGVPENIRDHFQTARNLIIYSWFYYPFNVTAQLCAYTSVEFALRIRAGNSKARPSFAGLLKQAVEKGWIRDEGFSHIKSRYESLKAYNEGLPAEFHLAQSPLTQEYCKVMCRTLPSLRNTLAHGSTFLHHGGSGVVRICGDLINQLFETSKTT
jgi:hypothetical protein